MEWVLGSFSFFFLNKTGLSHCICMRGDRQQNCFIWEEGEMSAVAVLFGADLFSKLGLLQSSSVFCIHELLPHGRDFCCQPQTSSWVLKRGREGAENRTGSLGDHSPLLFVNASYSLSFMPDVLLFSMPLEKTHNQDEATACQGGTLSSASQRQQKVLLERLLQLWI